MGLAFTSTARIEMPNPIPVMDLLAFITELPNVARIALSPIVGGSQRDPETTGYRILAKWESSS